MRALTHYVFRSIWYVPASPADTYAVLEDLTTYPLWWPEVKEVRELDVGHETVCRSLLPYELRFVTRAGVQDPEAGVLEGLLYGDLHGYSRWTIRPHEGGSRLAYDQEVDTAKGLLNALAPLARPAFRANHAVMMRHGQAGLRTYLAGYTKGRAR